MKNSFELVRAKSGAWSARHKARGVLLCSAVDPIREAEEIARKLCEGNYSKCFVIGRGLGYLEDALLRRGVKANAIEPFLDVDRFWQECNPAGEKCGLMDCGSHANSVEMIQSAGLDRNTQLYVAPYVRALLDTLPKEMSELISEVVVLSNSRAEYAPLIERNLRMNSEIVRCLPRLDPSELVTCFHSVVCGAGPSLRSALKTMAASRAEFQLIACSSAVPILTENDLKPDWTVALEAHSVIADDIYSLDDGAKVIVFPWTDSSVLTSKRLQLFLVEEGYSTLVTSGGTTLLTAADFASKITSRALYLTGADLSWSHGLHADEMSHSATSQDFDSAPKFEFMRKNVEKWIQSLPENFVNHVISDESLVLEGAKHITPEQLEAALRGALVYPQTCESK